MESVQDEKYLAAYPIKTALPISKYLLILDIIKDKYYKHFTEFQKQIIFFLLILNPTLFLIILIVSQLNIKAINTMQIGNVEKPEKKQVYKIIIFFQAISQKMGRENFGLLLMVISQIIWPLSFLYPSEKNVSPVQTNLIRTIVTMISHYFIIKYFNFSFEIKQDSKIKLVTRRNMIVCLHQFVLTGSLFILPYPIVFTLNTSCVLFVFVVDYLLFNIKINKEQTGGVILGFIGVLLTVNGEYFISKFYPERQKQTDFKHYITDDPFLKLTAAIVLVVVNFFRAYALSIMKTIKKMNGFELSFHFGYLLLFECAIIYPIAVTKQSQIDDLLWTVIYSGIPQNIVQVLFMSALILSKNTGITNLMCFLTIVVSYIISLVRFNERVNEICLVGVGLIFYGIVRTLSNREQHQK